MIQEILGGFFVALPIGAIVALCWSEARKQAVGKSIGRQLRANEWRSTVVVPPRPDWIDDVLRRANDNGTEDESA